MPKISFEAESDLELYLIINNYLRTFFSDKDPKNLPNTIKRKIYFERFSKLNPIGSLITSNTRRLKHFPIGKKYEIINYEEGYGENEIIVLLKGENEKTSWINIEKLSGYIPYK